MSNSALFQGCKDFQDASFSQINAWFFSWCCHKDNNELSFLKKASKNSIKKKDKCGCHWNILVIFHDYDTYYKGYQQVSSEWYSGSGERLTLIEKSTI